MNVKNLSRKIQIQILRLSIIIHGGSLESAIFSHVHDLDLGSGSHGKPSCITHQPLSAYQIQLKSENLLWTDGRTDGRTDRQTLRPDLLG